MTGPIMAAGSLGGPTLRVAYAALTASSTSSLRSSGTSIRVAATHAWPAVMATTLRSAGRNAVQGVGQIDLGRLAAELQRDALHRRCRLGQDLAADGGRTGERDHVHGRIGGEHLSAGRATLDHHAQHTWR